jgi:lysozyme
MQPGVFSNGFGVDVSSFQGHPDWAQVRAAGKVFALQRATVGTTLRDASFPTNWRQTRALGLRRGAYHVAVFGEANPTDPVDDANRQAAAFLAAVDAAGGIQGDDLPPFVDCESAGNPHGWSPAAQVAWVLQWTAAVDAAVKNPAQRAGIYGSPAFLAPWATVSATDRAALAQRPLWIARWDPNGAPANVVDWTAWTCWQYSDRGTVPGIDGPVDLDEWHTALDALPGDPTTASGGAAPPSVAQQVAALQTTVAQLQATTGELRAAVQTLQAGQTALQQLWRQVRASLAAWVGGLP